MRFKPWSGHSRHFEPCVLGEYNDDHMYNAVGGVGGVGFFFVVMLMLLVICLFMMVMMVVLVLVLGDAGGSCGAYVVGGSGVGGFAHGVG